MVHITALGAFSRASRLPWGDTPAMVWSPFHVQHEGLSAASTRGRPRGGHCRPRRLPIKARTAPHIVGAPGLDGHNRRRQGENDSNMKSSRGQRTQTYVSLRLAVFDPARPGCAP